MAFYICGLFKPLNDPGQNSQCCKISSSVGGVLGILGIAFIFAYSGKIGKGDDKHIPRASL